MPHFTLRRSGDARVLVVSQRLRFPQISRCTLYEFEDLVSEFDAADVVCPSTPPATIWTHRTLRRLHRLTGWHPQLRPTKTLLDQDYQLVFFCCEDVGDLLRLGALPGWSQRAHKKVCYIEEMWADDLQRRRHETALLRGFDHVFVSCAGAVTALQDAIGVPVSYLAPSVDVLTFWPGTTPPARAIDVYAMGRRSPVTHQALLRVARERGLFYVYDTYAANRVIEPREHRFLLASLVQRTKYFVANRAKVDHSGTQAQEEIGSRHFEGAAGGAVMIGEPPQCATFHTHFDWPDAVVRMEWNTDRPYDVIRALEDDPERVTRIRADNLRHSLLRHDWVYRWQQVLDVVGMQGTPALHARKRTLLKFAESLQRSTPAPAGH